MTGFDLSWTVFVDEAYQTANQQDNVIECSTDVILAANRTSWRAVAPPLVVESVSMISAGGRLRTTFETYRSVVPPTKPWIISWRQAYQYKS